MYNQSKTVVYIGGFNLPNGNAAAQRVVANAKLMMALGYKVLLVGLSSKGNIGKYFAYERIQCINLKHPKSAGEWFKYLFGFDQYLPFFKEYEPEIIVAYNHPSIALNRLVDYCKAHSIKIVSDCTEWYVPHGNWLFRKIKGWDIDNRMFKVHCRVDGLIAISKYLYNFYTERGIHTLLLPPLVDKKENKWQQTSDKSSNRIRLIFAGFVGAGFKDRLDLILNAICELAQQRPDVYAFDIVGITENQFKSVYIEWKSRSIPSFVHFHGRINHEEVIRLLLNADFQIFIRENTLANTAGFPTKFAETISANTLVLTNESSNIKDYLREGYNGFLLDISSEESLVKSLQIPLSLTKEEIEKIRKEMDNGIFDYRRYLEEMKRFVDSL